MEFPIEFFLDYARDPSRWNQDNLSTYTKLWAARNFGPKHAAEIADLISKYTKYNGRRKPEQLEPDTFSLTHFQEAERVESEWQAITKQAERIQQELPPAYHDAFFELVLYPVKASAIVNELYITAGENRLYATQGRVSANDLATRARSLFAADAALSSEYNHQLAHGKWDHMMDQTHIGYTFWNQPPLNAMPAVSDVQPASGAKMGIAVEGSAIASDRALGFGGGGLSLPTFDVYNQQTRFIDVFNQGNQPFAFTVRADHPWIAVTPDHGIVAKDQRLLVHIDWSQVPAGENSGAVSISQQSGPTIVVHLVVSNPTTPSRKDLQGFVENNDYVSIEAAHFTSRTSEGSVHWSNLPDFGETLSGMTIFPVTAESVLPPQPAASLEYKMYLFQPGTYQIEAILAPTLNFVPGRGLRYAISFDDHPPLVVDALADNSEKAWATAVSDGVRKVTSELTIVQAGYHTLKFRMVDPGVVLEKIVISQGEVPSSYLGPPESCHHPGSVKPGDPKDLTWQAQPNR